MSNEVYDFNIGHSTAYAYAKASGDLPEGMTPEEYGELLASYATVGQTAVTAAQTATTKASEAATSATTATNKATEATTAATTATNKAAEAQADADAAALDASQALSAASTATSKATEATTAAATATSAATTATTAKDDAVSAKTAAQTAQTGAETAAASVEASAEQIATNAEDISQLKSKLTAVEEDLEHIFAPGINLYDKDKRVTGHYLAWNTGNIGESATYNYTDYIEIEPGTYYTISNTDQTCIYDENKNYIGGFYIQANGNINVSPNLPDYSTWMSGQTTGEKPITILAQQGWKYIRQTVYNAYAQTLMFVKGQTLPPFSPYTVTKANLSVSAEYITNVGNTDISRMFSKLLKTQPRIKFIGDSITAGYGGTGYDDTQAGGGELVVNFGGGVYSNVSGHCLVNSVKAYWEEKFGCTVKNFGWTGASSSRLIEYWSQLVNVYDDIIICMIGANDRGQHENVSGLINNLETIYQNSVKLNKPIIFMASIPASVNNETSGNKNFHMEDVEHAVRYITDLHNLPFINLYQGFLDYCTYKEITIDSLLKDGLHPNDNGYDVMFEIFSRLTNISPKRPGATW